MLKITYKGIELNSIQDAIIKAAASGMKTHIETKLSPFMSEIRRSGGTVDIDISPDLKKNTLKISNIAPELKTRIEQALK